MVLHEAPYRNRAANALHSLVGAPGRNRVIGQAPAAVEMTEMLLLIVAGDNERPLSPTALRPLAVETGRSVLATWVDPMLSGHRFLIDAVVMDAGQPRVFAERSLFRTPTGASLLVDATGGDPAIAIDATGVRIAPRQPYSSELERMLGIAAGQALLQQRIYAGTPYATPLPRNLGR